MLGLSRRAAITLTVALAALGTVAGLTGCGRDPGQQTDPPQGTSTPASASASPGATPSASPSVSPSGPASPSASPSGSASASASSSASESASASGSSSAIESALTIEITLSGDTVTPNGEKYDVGVGEKVTLKIASDHDDVVHMHGGAGVEVEVKAGGTAEVSFTVDQSGSYEIESHHPQRIIAILNVR